RRRPAPARRRPPLPARRQPPRRRRRPRPARQRTHHRPAPPPARLRQRTRRLPRRAIALRVLRRRGRLDRLRGGATAARYSPRRLPSGALGRRRPPRIPAVEPPRPHRGRVAPPDRGPPPATAA